MPFALLCRSITAVVGPPYASFHLYHRPGLRVHFYDTFLLHTYVLPFHSANRVAIHGVLPLGFGCCAQSRFCFGGFLDARAAQELLSFAHPWDSIVRVLCINRHIPSGCRSVGGVFLNVFPGCGCTELQLKSIQQRRATSRTDRCSGRGRKFKGILRGVALEPQLSSFASAVFLVDRSSEVLHLLESLVPTSQRGAQIMS